MKISKAQALYEWSSGKHNLTEGDLKKHFLQFVHDNFQLNSGFYRVKKKMLVFKAARGCNGRTKLIVALEIPQGARIYADNICWNSWKRDDRKMRASKAKVHSIWTQAGDERKVAYSDHDRRFEYNPGKIVLPHRFGESALICSGGIHFFINFSDAYNYLL